MCPYCGSISWTRHGGGCRRNLRRLWSRALANPRFQGSMFLTTVLAVVSSTVAFLYLR
jgi:hypothetical protein